MEQTHASTNLPKFAYPAPVAAVLAVAVVVDAAVVMKYTRVESHLRLPATSSTTMASGRSIPRDTLS